MTPQNKPKVKVFASGREWGVELNFLPEDMEGIVAGSAFYGERYKEAILSPLARRELSAAVKLIAWYTQFQCRFSKEPKAITELLNYDKREKN